MGNSDKNTFSLKLVRLRATASDFRTLNMEIKLLKQDPNLYWYAIGHRLQRIHSEKLYKVKYKYFDDYCRKELGFLAQYGHKLMKAVKFIDEQLEQAHNEEKQTMVECFFKLGFIKLNLLLPLPIDYRRKLLDEGLTILNYRGRTSRMQLENAPVAKVQQIIKSLKFAGKITA